MRHAVQDFKQRFSRRQRAGIVSLGLVELSMKIRAARDIQRRRADQIRGSKLLWLLVLLVNTFGPLAYFLLGRSVPQEH